MSDDGADGRGPTVEPAGDVADWTVLVYMMGGDDLEPFAVGDLLEMGELTPSDRVNIITLVDRHPGYAIDDDPFGDFDTAQLFRVSPGGLAAPGAVSDGEEINVGDPGTLAAFIADGIESAPAERYAVVLWNHGAGWPGMGPDETDGNDAWSISPTSTRRSNRASHRPGSSGSTSSGSRWSSPRSTGSRPRVRQG